MKSEEDEDAGYASFQEVKVVLKVLGSEHKDISLVRHNYNQKRLKGMNLNEDKTLHFPVYALTRVCLPCDRLSTKQPAICTKSLTNTLCCSMGCVSVRRRVSAY